MARPTRPSFPAPSEPNLRRLGLGGAGGTDRPLRAQLVVVLVGLLVLIAVPLYLWRRPSGAEEAEPLAATSSASARASALGLALAAPAPTPSVPERLTVGAIQKVKCGASPRGGRDGAQCDSLPFFEEALTKAVRENADCAPADGEGTINYVLQVDFTQASVHVFPGASGKWKGPGARKATRCVKQALPAPNWSAIPHQYRFYQIALLATYRVAQAAPVAAPSGSALFE